MKEVSHTLFYPLLGRAQASHTWPHMFPDPWAFQAEKIAEQENTPAQPLNTFTALCYGLRHLFTIREITQYLDMHPGAAVVNIGCGLDVLAEDLSDYDCTIYNLDFPDVIDMRHRWVPEADNEIDLPYSVTDHEWLTKVSGDKGVIAVAPGVFYYLTIPEVSALVDAFGQAFPGGRLVYETESPMVMRGSEKQIAKHGTPVSMPFKVKDPYTPQDWSDTVRDYHVTFNCLNYLSPEHRKEIPARYRALFGIFERIQGLYVVNMGF
jgi:hypothetical protein